MFLGSSLISWKTKKQKTISKRIAEVEYRSMSYATSEIIWLINLLKDLSVDVVLPVTLHRDNKVAQHIAQNPVFHEKTKHLDIDCHFSRDEVQEGLLQPQFVRSGLQIADIITKPLGVKLHQFMCIKLEGGM